jgi:mannose-6-phosphate isomerase-like protein (cupin superfamily)
VVETESLRQSPTAALFEGAEFGGIAASSFILSTPPGAGPSLHVHPYAEVFVVLHGQVTFRVGDRTIEAHGGQIVIGPARVPHKFTNTGAEALSMVSIHPNDHVVQEWLREPLEEE